MSQHDMDIANQGFPATRSDFNLALKALASNNSGATAPSTTYAFMWWADTTDGILKLRNEADTAWIDVFDFDNNQLLAGAGVLEGTAPSLDFYETDGTSTHNRARFVQDGDVFSIQVRTGADTLVSADFQATFGASGVTNYLWQIAGASALEIDSAGDLTIYEDDGTTPGVVWDASTGYLGVGGTPTYPFEVFGNAKLDSGAAATNVGLWLSENGTTVWGMYYDAAGTFWGLYDSVNSLIPVKVEDAAPANSLHVVATGVVRLGTTSSTPSASNVPGIALAPDGTSQFSATGTVGISVNRKTSDGGMVNFLQDGTYEGGISVSGTTVSYVGGHLARWSRLLESDTTPETALLKGTVMSNLGEMIVWRNLLYTNGEGEIVTEPYSGEVSDGEVLMITRDGVTFEAVVETEDNEQLNHTKISDAEADPNVAGVVVALDESDEHGDYFLAMAGDMVVRIHPDAVVKKGDLLITAGNGTAKPQADDIVRSSTFAKVNSGDIRWIYPDGSYCVPCTLKVA